MLKCTRCRVTAYCNVLCQRNDWKVHKKVCAVKPDPLRCFIVIEPPPAPKKELNMNLPRKLSDFQKSHMLAIVTSKAFIGQNLGSRNPLFLFLLQGTDELKDLLKSSRLKCVRGYDKLGINKTGTVELQKKRKAIVSLCVPFDDYAQVCPSMPFIDELRRTSLMEGDVWFFANFCGERSYVEVGTVAKLSVDEELKTEPI
jgi:hypothetical protein